MSFLINPYAFLAAGGDFESIATVTVGSGGAANIEFTSIPGTYQHLQLRLIARGTGASTASPLDFRLNGATTGYSYHYLGGDGSSAAASGGGSAAYLYAIGYVANGGATSSVFGAAVIDILDYANTSKNTTVRALTGFDNNGSGAVRVTSGGYFSTTAVTSISVIHTSGNFAQHSTAALYGIKAP